MVGVERIAGLRPCAGNPSEMAQGHLGGDVMAQKRWVGRCVAIGMETAM